MSAYYKTLQGVSDSAVTMARNAQGATVNIQALGTASKATEIGLKALRIAGNMLLALAISEAISLVIKGVDYLIHRNEKLIESANEVTNTYREQSKTLNDNVSSLQKQKDEFNRLSQGVDDYGNNISLTSDEYDRYKSIVSEILGYTPELIAGYDEEGNAIAKKNGLIEQSIALMKEEQRQKLKEMTSDENTKTIWKGAKAEYSNSQDTLNKQLFLDNVPVQSTRHSSVGNYGRGTDATSTVFTGQHLKSVLESLVGEKFLDNEQLDDYLKKHKSIITKNYDEIRKALTNPLITQNGTIFGLNDDDAGKLIDWIDDIYDSIADLDKLSHGMDNQFSLYAQKSEYYEELTDAQKHFVNEYIKATGSIIDAEGNFLSADKIQEKADGFTDFVDEIVTNDKFEEAREKMNDLFSLDKSKLSASDYEQQVNAILDFLVKEIDGFEQDDANKIKISLGFEFLSDGSTRVGTLINDVKGKLKDEFKGKVDNMTLEDLVDASKLEIPEGTLLTWDEFIEKMAEAKATANTFSLDSFNKSIDDIQSAYNTLTKAKNEWNKNGAYSLDTVQALLALEPKYLAMLVNENGQLKLNEQAMHNLINAQLEEAKAKIYQNGISQLNALISEKTGEASKEAAQNKANSVIDINAETEALGLNTEAKLQNVAATARSKGVSDEEINKIVDETIRQANAIQSAVDGMAIDFDGVVGGFSDTKDKADDLAKSEALTKLKYKFDQIHQSVEKTENAISLLNSTLELTSEDDYTTKLEITSRMLGLVQQKAALLRDEFAQLDAQEYNSADSANELATRMKSVADSIAENNKDIINYGKNIAEYYTSALTSISSLSKSTVDEATNLLDRNIKSLSEGGLVGLSFNLSPTIPKSALDKQKEQNRSMEAEMQSYYDTVAQMQKAALDLEYQEQMASYAEQREELDGTLTKSKEAIKKSADETLTETKDFSNQTQNVVTNLNDWMTKNPITAPNLDTSKWEGLVKDAENYAKRVQDAFNGSSDAKRNALIQAARSQIGSHYKEDYAVNGSINPTQWCNDFVSWAAKQAGLDNIIPMGSYTPDTAARFGDNLIPASSGYKPQIGDIAYYSSNGKESGIHHVEMVTGFDSDGNIITIGGNTGRNSVVAERARKDKPAFYGTYAKGTKPFGYNGVAGEDKPEYLIDKKTGKMTRIDSPTLINTDEVDVVGQNDTARAERHKYAKGTIKVPDGLGKYYTYMNWDTITNMDTEQGRLINTAGKSYDSEGYGKIGERYALAMTSTFGKIGDCVDIYMSNGRVIQGILADEKSQVKTAWDNNPANTWGHDNGQSVVEFITNWKNHDNPMSDGTVVKVENLGSYFESPELANDISATATNTGKLAQVDFKTAINDILNAEPPQKSAWEGDLLAYIRETADLSTDHTEEMLQSFDKLAAYQDSQVEYFKGYEQQLLDSVGTDHFQEVNADISKASQSYIREMIKASTDITVKGIKDTFDNAKSIQDTILQYYEQRKNEGASYDELKVIMDAYNTQAETVQELSDQYVSAMSTYTDYLVSLSQRETQAYSDRISWSEKLNDKLERDLDNATSIAEKEAIYEKMKANLSDELVMYAEQQKAAHANVMALYEDEAYKPIFKEFDLETWFDANGDATSKFEIDKERMTASGKEELVPLMNRIFNVIQDNKKVWYNAGDAIDSINDKMDGVVQNEALNQVDQYTDYLGRLNDIKRVEVEYDQAITSAMKNHYSMAQTLRTTLNDITEELDINKHLSEWLDEDTRALLFNDEDYDILQKEISSIQKESDKLFNKYQKDLSNLNETTWYQEAEITAEYERQSQALEERLGIAQKQLEVSKKQTEYDNIAKERDTRIILGGRAVQVADPDKLYNAAKAVSKAENDLTNTQLTNAENESVRNSERITDAVNQEIAAREKMVELINGMSDEEKVRFAIGLPATEVIEQYMRNLSPTNIPWLNTQGKQWQGWYNNLSDKQRQVGYDLTWDYSAQYEKIERMYRDGLITLETLAKLLFDASDRHDVKARSDLNNSQYEQHTQYGASEADYAFGLNHAELKAKSNEPVPVKITDEQLPKKPTGDEGKPRIDSPESLTLADKIKERYTPIDPKSLLLDPSKQINLDNFVVTPTNYALDTTRNLANTLPSTVQNIQNQATNQNITNVNVSGGVNIKTPMDNATANKFANELINDVSDRYDITKNMRK